MNSQRIEAAIETLRSLGSNLCSHPTVTASTLHIFHHLSSTNQTLWEFMPTTPSGTVVIAMEQTAGRGQWGRQWQSTPGGLYLSMGVKHKIAIAQQTQLTIASAWGIATQLQAYGIPVQLKWPNDLILNGRKLGGILTETKICQHHITQAVIGVGINWSNSVPETGINLQDFLTQSADPPKIHSLELLTALVIYGIEQGLQHCLHGKIEDLIKGYLELLTSLGRFVNINGNSGKVIGVTPTGELRVQLNSTASSGDREVDVKPGTISLGYD